MTKAKARGKGRPAAAAKGAAAARAELLAVTESLRIIRDRAEAVAGQLELQARGADEVRTRQVIHVVQTQLWGLAGELIGVQQRLVWLAADLRAARQPAEETASDELLDSAAELLSTIQCVIADSLNPAVDALVRASLKGAAENGAPPG